MVRIEAQLLPEEAELLWRALEAAVAAARKAPEIPSERSTDVPAEISPSANFSTPRSADFSRVDALVEVARGFLTDGKATASTRSPYQVMVHTSQEALTR